MEIEMKLQDALYTAVVIFKEKISAINADMKNKTIAFIKMVAEESEGFSDRIREAALKESDAYAAKIEANEEEELIEEN
jgi:hypothetical protein